MKLSMEELVEFLQETLAKDFFFEDDFVIEQLQVSMTELKRAKLDLPEPGKKCHGPSSNSVAEGMTLLTLTLLSLRRKHYTWW